MQKLAHAETLLMRVGGTAILGNGDTGGRDRGRYPQSAGGKTFTMAAAAMEMKRLDSRCNPTAACQGQAVPLAPLLAVEYIEKGLVNQVIRALIGYMLGSVSGVVLMCMLQINYVGTASSFFINAIQRAKKRRF